MKRTGVAICTMLLGASAVMADQQLAVQQDKLMRTMGEGVYVTFLKMGKGDIPYDQAKVDAALAELEKDAPTIPTVFATDPKEQVINTTYGYSDKIWQNKADFDSKVPPVLAAIASLKGKIKDQASVKVAFDTMHKNCSGCHETYRLKLK